MTEDTPKQPTDERATAFETNTEADEGAPHAPDPSPARPPVAGPAPRAERRRLTHLDRSGRPRMVDVSAKPPTARRAVAEAFVTLSAETLSLVIEGGNEKGDVLSVAELAGVMGGKRTSELIPLCHPLPLSVVDVELSVGDDRVEITTVAETVAQTGVEMEALVAASVAALTVYDMAKAIDSDLVVAEVRLLEKTKEAV
jgi:cyclic pyranopterin monophosphate synthase